MRYISQRNRLRQHREGARRKAKNTPRTNLMACKRREGELPKFPFPPRHFRFNEKMSCGGHITHESGPLGEKEELR